jgi:hypothetical protein
MTDGGTRRAAGNSGRRMASAVSARPDAAAAEQIAESSGTPRFRTAVARI